ncbi:hypothetical protein NQ315_001362 [Exocentrus adspersus]|uniref:Fibronectin type III domain protein n=1 Tax=Exocentrus adspersus TaxID=1586481 RepID=A0AAV8WG18_9CUCU|nr:hypothetical protein NQ315_001362 [Exocentrus adspersus]
MMIMSTKYVITVVAALLVLFTLSNPIDAQACSPHAVRRVEVSAYHILFWEVHEEEKCNITQYLVSIYHTGEEVQYDFEVNTTFVDVSFLKSCERWTFRVIAVANGTKGSSHFLFSNVPLPIGANLSIAYVNYTYDDSTSKLHLNWDLSDLQFGSCRLRYRVTIEDDESTVVEDQYSDIKSLTLGHVAPPCTKYEIGVRAINLASPVIEGPLKITIHEIVPTKQIPPKLISVQSYATGFNLTWRLESKEVNACEVREFYLDGGRYFNVSVLYDDDGRERGDVEVNVHNLRSNSMYTMSASLMNSAGWSDPFPVAVQTMEFSSDVKID